MVVFTLKAGIKAQTGALEGRPLQGHFLLNPGFTQFHQLNEVCYGGSIYFQSIHTHTHPTRLMFYTISGLVSCFVSRDNRFHREKGGLSTSPQYKREVTTEGSRIWLLLEEHIQNNTSVLRSLNHHVPPIQCMQLLRNVRTAGPDTHYLTRGSHKLPVRVQASLIAVPLESSSDQGITSTYFS